MRRLLKWLRAGWSLYKKQAACDHRNAPEHGFCPDCDADTDLGSRAW